MYMIGLTGGIASGKSTVSGILNKLGACIVDADKLSRTITRKGQPAWLDIVNRFGEGILNPDNEIDRKLLGQVIFADSQARTDLECITHPRIKAEVDMAILDAARQGCTVVVLDVPLLIEVKWQTMVDAIWVVFVDEKTQIDRLMEREHIDYDTAIARIRAQMPLTDKLKYADIVIDNSNTVESTYKQVVAAWTDMKQIANSGS